MQIPEKPISDRVLDLIGQHDGKLDWIEIAAAVGADSLAERSHIFAAVRSLERRGKVRRQHGEGDARYWIV
jgi:DNA-binding MarR family transcriptional regulator